MREPLSKCFALRDRTKHVSMKAEISELMPNFVNYSTSEATCLLLLVHLRIYHFMSSVKGVSSVLLIKYDQSRVSWHCPAGLWSTHCREPGGRAPPPQCAPVGHLTTPRLTVRYCCPQGYRLPRFLSHLLQSLKLIKTTWPALRLPGLGLADLPRYRPQKN